MIIHAQKRQIIDTVKKVEEPVSVEIPVSAEMEYEPAQSEQEFVKDVKIIYSEDEDRFMLIDSEEKEK